MEVKISDAPTVCVIATVSRQDFINSDYRYAVRSETRSRYFGLVGCIGQVRINYKDSAKQQYISFACQVTIRIDYVRCFHYGRPTLWKCHFCTHQSFETVFQKFQEGWEDGLSAYHEDEVVMFAHRSTVVKSLESEISHAQLALKKRNVEGESSQMCMDGRIVVPTSYIFENFFWRLGFVCKISDAMFCLEVPMYSSFCTLSKPVGISLMYRHWSHKTDDTVSSCASDNGTLKFPTKN